MGEVAAAYCAGALSLEDALRVVVVRSRLLADIAGKGAMALVDLSEEEVDQLLDPVRDRVSVAAINGPRSTVISGEPGAVDELLEALDDDGIFCRRVRVDVASHSSQTDPLLSPLREQLSRIEPMVPPAAFYSTARPGSPTDQLLGPDYWVDNLRRPVRLMSAIRAMIGDGVDTFIEIAPHPVLLSSLADIAADANASIRTLAGPRREESELQHMMQLLSRVHVAGGEVLWERLAAPTAEVLRLPAYPWQRERHWLDSWEDWSGATDSVGPAATRPEGGDDLTYRVEWRPVAVPATPEPLSGAWFLVDNGSGLAAACAERLKGAGATPHIATSPAELRVLLRGASGGGGIAGVVHFTGGEQAPGDGAADEFLLSVTTGAALDTIQTLLELEVAAPTWWVTRGVQTLPGRAGDEAAWRQAAVWGLARTLWQEHPELDAHLVDFASGSESAADHLIEAISAFRGEPQLAFGDDGAFVARVVAAGREALSGPARWRADGSYLITGGLGALGLIAAEELVRGGARRLVLMARTPMPPRREWATLTASPMAERAAGVQRLEALGASVHLAAVDAGDAAAVESWLEDYRAEGWPPIRGVVHCAGALDNHLLRDLTQASLVELVRGKAGAAANLARLIPEVERTVYFSSTVAVLPQPGQGNYAAANAALDALAAARTAAGKPTVSLGWGVWKGAGLVADARVGRYVETMEASGLGSFDPAEARELFNWAAASRYAHLVLAPIDWSVARSRVERRPGAPFYHDLIAVETGAEQQHALSLLLESAVPGTRAALLVDHLRAMVARILDVTASAVAPNQPLGRQGLDSLMALEFRNRLEGQLQLRLPASLTWNYPTLERMSEHLLERLELTGAAAPVDDLKEIPLVAEAIPLGIDPQLRAEIEDLSDEEILQQLRTEV
jgi:epothilone polyketide synthase E